MTKPLEHVVNVKVFWMQEGERRNLETTMSVDELKEIRAKLASGEIVTLAQASGYGPENDLTSAITGVMETPLI